MKRSGPSTSRAVARISARKHVYSREPSSRLSGGDSLVFVWFGSGCFAKIMNASGTDMMKNSIIILLCAILLWLPACAQAPTIAEESFLHPPTKAPTPTLYPAEEIDLKEMLDPQGRALTFLQLQAPDGCMRLEIEQGTAILDADGSPAARLIIQQDYPGKPPMEAFGVSASWAYRFGPDELRFSSPVKIVFSCLKNFKKTFVSETSLGMKADEKGWEQLSVQAGDGTVWTRLEGVQPGWQYFLVGPAPMGS